MRRISKALESTEQKKQKMLARLSQSAHLSPCRRRRGLHTTCRTLYSGRTADVERGAGEECTTPRSPEGEA